MASDSPSAKQAVRPWLIRAYAPEDREGLLGLWQQCGLTRPWNNPNRDIERKRAHRPEWLRIAEVQRSAQRWELIGSIMIGYEGHRGWVNYLAVHPRWQGRGLGRALMEQAEILLLAEGCPKLSLLIRTDNAAVRAFYERLGYGVDQATAMGKRLIADD
jgi:ribosomal protein S18 acetylase RimI-like enzyme